MTVGSGSDRQLVVVAFGSCSSADTPPNVSGITYAGQALTLITSITAGAGRSGAMYAWPTGSQPTSGTNTVTVTMASSVATACPNAGGANRMIISGAISATGVDQTTTFTSSASNKSSNGSGTSATLTLSSSGADDMGVDIMCAGTNAGTTTETSRFTENDVTASCNSIGGATAAGGDTSFSWTFTADWWAIIGGALKAAAPPIITGCRLLQDGTSKRLLQAGSPNGRIFQGGGDCALGGGGGPVPAGFKARKYDKLFMEPF